MITLANLSSVRELKKQLALQGIVLKSISLESPHTLGITPDVFESRLTTSVIDEGGLVNGIFMFDGIEIWTRKKECLD